MAKPNYSFEKRQREQEKKRKKEDKAYRKANGLDTPADDAPADGEAPAPAADAAPPAPSAPSAG